MVEPVFISPNDIDWFAKIGNIYIHAMSFGGFIPRQVDIVNRNAILLYEAYRLDEVNENVNVMNGYVNERLHSQYELNSNIDAGNNEIRERYLRHFKEMARRGFYSYDRDIHDLKLYHLICKPAMDLTEWQVENVPILVEEHLVIDREGNPIQLVF